MALETPPTYEIHLDQYRLTLRFDYQEQQYLGELQLPESQFEFAGNNLEELHAACLQHLHAEHLGRMQIEDMAYLIAHATHLLDMCIYQGRTLPA
ncbi:hypothetical protein SAMN05421831_103225 [Allopseudospirillum japonicum]|uniref:Uncharacterized protein n=1 Tax=Allopseudospirillum japonicum TaxID=64971 RepID=A0A1H6RB62_9GAMM|nr:hypothetical protein [Allopseudospirillum japonicum]SEI52983.1 hypothetical protein SAMN05421831_103225 [Allopseudospirillum japonicum]